VGVSAHENFPRNRDRFRSFYCIYLSQMGTERQLEPGSAEASPVQPAGSSENGELKMAPEAGLAEMPGLSGVLAAGDTGIAIRRIPIEVDVAIPIRKFRVRNLLSLSAGQVITTPCVEGEDLPLGARGAQLAWTEFEVVDHKLAVRITRMA